MSSYRFGRPWRRAQPRRRRLSKFWDYSLTFVILGLLTMVAARLDRVETRQAAGAAVVNDGDSLTLGAQKVRLRGIDAPEYNQTCRREGEDYPCGRRSRDALGKLIAGRPVSCTGWERDRYGRLLATCSAGKDDLNKSQVASGWAVAYGDYAELEDRARAQGIGIWAGEFERPRDWRQSHGGTSDSEHDRIAAIVNWLRAIFFQ